MNQHPPNALDPSAQTDQVPTTNPPRQAAATATSVPPIAGTSAADASAGGSAPPREAFETCQECGAPMSRQQRYCVNCAARRSGADNPSTQYFAAASRWRRRGGVRQEPEIRRVGKPAAVAALCLLPVAIAGGILIGRGDSGSGVSDAALLAAMNSGGGATAAATTGETGATAKTVADTSTTGEVLKSDFKLDDGYTVKIDLLPVSSTDSASAKAAASAAEGKGAKDVGVINPSDFQLKPDQGTEDYVLFSGQFKSKGEADKALASRK